jgi:hypothetical protein
MAEKLGRLLVEYDDYSDVLYLALGDPVPALTEEAREGLLIRRDPETTKPVGVTITSYGRHFRRLKDLSWLGAIGLPEDVVHYLEKQPEFFRF